MANPDYEAVGKARFEELMAAFKVCSTEATHCWNQGSIL